MTGRTGGPEDTGESLALRVLLPVPLFCLLGGFVRAHTVEILLAGQRNLAFLPVVPLLWLPLDTVALVVALVLLPARALCVAHRPGPPHLEVLPGHVHPDELRLGPVVTVSLVDARSARLGLGQRADGPLREEFALVRFDFERAAVVAGVPVPLRMRPEIRDTGGRR